MEQETIQQPPKKPSISIGAAIVTAAVIIGLILIGINSQKTVRQPEKVRPEEVTSVPSDVATIRSTDHIRGTSTPSIIVIEYSDSDCPFCSKFHATMQEIVKEYSDSVAWIYRYYPLAQLHPNATTEAVALECVAQLKGAQAFTAYLDKLIGITLSSDPKSNEMLTTLAKEQGVDAAAFKNCFADTKASDRVKADSEEAQKIGAQGTPFSIIVNVKTGKQKIIAGAYPIEDIRKEIDALLK